MHIKYAVQATIKVQEKWSYEDVITVHVSRDYITVSPPVLPSTVNLERTRKVAQLLASAATRGVLLHRRMFGRGPQ